MRLRGSNEPRSGERRKEKNLYGHRPFDSSPGLCRAVWLRIPSHGLTRGAFKRHFADEEFVELAAIIALENFRSKYNPVFAVESQGFCPLPAVAEAAAPAASQFHVR